MRTPILYSWFDRLIAWSTPPCFAQDVERDVPGRASREHGRDDVRLPVTGEIAVHEPVEAATVPVPDRRLDARRDLRVAQQELLDVHVMDVGGERGCRADQPEREHDQARE